MSSAKHEHKRREEMGVPAAHDKKKRRKLKEIHKTVAKESDAKKFYKKHVTREEWSGLPPDYVGECVKTLKGSRPRDHFGRQL